MGWNNLLIPKLQWLDGLIVGMDKKFNPTLYNGCNYVSMLWLKLNRVSKSLPSSHNDKLNIFQDRYRHKLGSLKYDIKLEYDLPFWDLYTYINI